ncbi:PIN domain-containing protein [Myceligenerans salitolerans]|uniref:DUF4935 domain-containing protein n=1 Tax=Myceligenerans salitolerans TaxID=1230528 RepID=A0ABS3IA71_9MICO|nr:PIN domain-containing protein [Myceligenerans salitolerans]MBO0609863.1 DUF4935 domain-containing protein [Myceligenerans salitolerans]
MTPVVILDTNALHGRKPFTRADSKILLELSRGGHLRLIIPDVVLHELSRQWAERLSEGIADMDSALKRINDALIEIGAAECELTVPSHRRAVFYDFARQLLIARRVEIPGVPDVAVADLMARDLDVRKPFDREGKGFRDALIWETIRGLCNELSDPSIPVVFVTSNHTDFCSPKNRELHPNLRQDLHADQVFDIVTSLHALNAHASIKPQVEQLRVLQKAFTRKRIEGLVDAAIKDLHGVDVEQALGAYAGDGFYDVPISSALDSPAFEEILPDNSSIESEIFRSGDGELTIRVVVVCNVSLEGFIDKSDYLVSDDDVTLLEDWNSHVFHASDSHRVRFTLSAEFAESDLNDLDDVVLTVDEAEEF